MTETLLVDARHPDRAALERAADRLRLGALVAFPTETVYGLGVHALDRAAVRRLFAVKGRPSDDPLIVHVATADRVETVAAAFPEAARALASRFWPGPLTLVLPRRSSVPSEVVAGLGTVAVRVPAHQVALALLDAAGVPVAAPSANLFSRPSPTTAQHVRDDFDGRIDMILDAGPTRLGLESTVVDLSGAVPRVLRPGAVAVEELRAVIPDVQVGTHATPAAGTAAASPGMLSKHYAPRAPMTLYVGRPEATRAALADAARTALAARRKVGALVTSEEARALEGLPVVVADVGPADRPEQVATRLYAALRELDAAGVDLILACDSAGDEGLWRALGDRLRRAAARSVAVE